jgi:rRNA maturation endonuclease Nob1
MRLIDADELKECFRWSEVCRLSISEINKIIDNAPTVELDESVIQEVLNPRHMTVVANEYLIALHGNRPQGEWEKIGEIGLAYKCNKCGEVNVIPTNFCPNCGAKMRKGGVDNDVR